jgi:hypothetical protein
MVLCDMAPREINELLTLNQEVIVLGDLRPGSNCTILKSHFFEARIWVTNSTQRRSVLSVSIGIMLVTQHEIFEEKPVEATAQQALDQSSF